jgi:iron complex outermembrane receptor protein
MKPFVRAIALLPFVFLCAGLAAAEDDFTVEWKTRLSDLERRIPAQAGDAAARRAWLVDAESLRKSVDAFSRRRPEIKIPVPAPLPETASREQMTSQLAGLTRAVDAVIAESPGTPFHLGRVTITVTAATAPAAPVATNLERTDMESHDFVNVAKALDFLPGVSIQHIASNRNEAGIMVRGFSSRGQVPMYLDGVPVYVPYDGYVDFNRYLTSDIAEIQAARGYSSPLLGPNALGGSINLVTRQPAKPLEGELQIGTGSGNRLLSSASLGGRRRKFFYQGTFNWLQLDFIPLPGDFVVRQYQNLPHVRMTDEWNHSYSRDEKYSGRFGWTPRQGDEYVFSYSNQKGNKGVPLYQGSNTAATFRNFWEWPYWNTDGVYFHSRTSVGENNAVKARAFYNRFRNSINMYSDDTYAAMNTRSAQHSMYNEHTEGFSAEWDNASLSGHAIGASFFLKNDTHTERGVYPGTPPYPLSTPKLADKARQISIGLQDAFRPLRRLQLTAGFSADHLNVIQAQSFNSASTALLPFTCLSSPGNTSFGGCTPHVWSFNPQISASYSVGDSGNFFLTFADRGRFPMLKDTYSASMGAGLPNPDLKTEHSRNWNAGYSHVFGARTVVKAVLFRSDLRNAIQSVYVTDPGGAAAATAYCPNSRIVGFCSQMVNIAGQVHQGVELEVRSTLTPRLSAEASYSYLNRTIAYDFAAFPNLSRVNTSVVTLPALPKNKAIGVLTARLPRRILGLASIRHEGGITVQDTTYPAASPLYLPRGESYTTVNLAVTVPMAYGLDVRAGVNNVFDREYYYTAGYPEIGRNWRLSLHYRF